MDRNFDAKIKFAKIAGGLSDEIAQTITIMHGYRSEVYHVSLKHESLLPALAPFYFDVACGYLLIRSIRHRIFWLLRPAPCISVRQRGVAGDEALEIAASLVDWVKDVNDAWDDCSMSQCLEYARNFVDQCAQLERFGLLCHMGHHRQLLREKERPDLTFVVGLLSIQPQEGVEGRRYALIHLESKWETVDGDRASSAESQRQ